MAAVDGKIYTSYRNWQYLTTSAALHMMLISAIAFYLIEEKIVTAKPLSTSVVVMLADATQRCPFKRVYPTELTPQKPVVQKHHQISAESISIPNSQQSSSISPLQHTQQHAQIAPATLTATSPTLTESSKTFFPSSASIQSDEPSKTAVVAKTMETPLTPAIFNAAYLNNPKPHYPKISKRLGEEGIVILKVRVLADGTAGSVSVLKSSDYERLDACAFEAVKQWRFVAAKQGEKNIESWVSVPVAFKLDS